MIELAPDFPRAHLALGKALLQEGKAADAVTALQNAVKLEPESGEANYQLGLALVRAGRKEEAAAQLKKGRDLVAAGDRAQNALLDIADGTSRARTRAISTRPSRSSGVPASCDRSRRNRSVCSARRWSVKATSRERPLPTRRRWR